QRADAICGDVLNVHAQIRAAGGRVEKDIGRGVELHVWLRGYAGARSRHCHSTDHGCDGECAKHGRIPLLAKPVLVLRFTLERDISSRSMDVQHRPASVEAAFGVELARPNIIRSVDLDLGKLALNPLASGGFYSRADRDAQAVRNIHNDIADGGLQARICECNSSASQRGNNGTASGLSADPAYDRADLNAAASGLHLDGSHDIVELDTAAAALRSDLADALVDLNSATSSFQPHYLAGSDPQVSAARFGRDLAARGIDVNAASAGLCFYIRSHLADINVAAATRSIDRAANLIELDIAAAGVGDDLA